MLAMSVSYGGFAADIHPVDADEISCQKANIATEHSGASQNGEDEQPDHDHHVHNCGSCHIHIAGAKITGVSQVTHSSLFLLPGSDQVAPRAGPHGLFRPPRA